MSLPNACAEALKRLERFGLRLGLESIQRLLEALGKPHLSVPVVLVGGTNGKGSTSAMLASIVGAAGYRVGLYTSPHVEDVEERVRVNGRSIDGEGLAEVLEEVLRVCSCDLPSEPTYFEALTAAAFVYFARHGVDLAVMEVGLGGRLDATNASEPILSLITPISFDHEQHLGSSLALIAGEKAGILRRGRPALSWVENSEAAQSLSQAALRTGAHLVAGNEAATIVDLTSRGWSGERVTLRTPQAEHRLDLPLPGKHQVSNMALAVLAAETLHGEGFPALDANAIQAGVAECRWPGRLERVEIDGPLGTRTVVLDGAHNAEATRSVLAVLEHRTESFDLLFGALDDKAVESMLPPLAKRARQVILTAPPSSRACSPQRLAELVSPRKAVIEPELTRAVELGLAADAPLLLVCGSLYLVGGVRGELRRRFGVPQPAVAIKTGAGGSG